MRFELIRPCANCPFRAKPYFFMGHDRRQEIADALTKEHLTFACHKTVDYNEDHPEIDTEQHCAGALIIARRQDIDNQMLQIAERLGLYDPARLDMDTVKTYPTFKAWVEAAYDHANRDLVIMNDPGHNPEDRKALRQWFREYLVGNRAQPP